MKVSLSELKKWVKISKASEELQHALTMAGLEVEGSELAAPIFSNIVVAEVLSVQPHPDADKLKVCEVDVGSEKLQIVCGAANVAAGCKVPAALIGAKLPNGMEIKKGKLRGVESFGMLCSKTELGLEEQSSGLWLLPSDAPVGKSIRDYLELDDVIIELSVTPNRGDCLSVLGVAREVAAIEVVTLKQNEIKKCSVEQTAPVNVQVQSPEACPRYLVRVIQDVHANAVTPLWLVEALRRMGIRSISPVVDVLNYVMLELGQPMHAFDFDKINGDIIIRQAKLNEKLTLLNQQEVTLNSEILVIADNEKPLAMAGIMGGLDSSVTNQTKNIVIESAFFVPHLIAGKARSYGLHTDSSQRFERGVDFNLPEVALERATELLLQIVGGKAGKLVCQEKQEFLPKLPVITIKVQTISAALGKAFKTEEVVNLLQSIGMTTKVIANDELTVHVPSHRFDIQIPADIIEEVARLHGYDHLPTKAISTQAITRSSNDYELERRLKYLLQDLGYNEAITYSFISAEQQKDFLQTEQVELSNPISQEMAMMRVSLWPGLLAAAQYNLNRQQNRIRFFEIGRCYTKQGEMLSQPFVLSGLLMGGAMPEQWAEKSRKVDFFDVKGHVEKILDSVGIQRAKFVPGKHVALHPGQSAQIVVDGKVIGELGLLHPQIAKNWDFKASIYLFELNLEALLNPRNYQFAAISKFPAIRRDFAFIVDSKVSADAILDRIRELSGKWLTDLILFDVFTSDSLGSHKKSVAFGLTLQDTERTLNDAEVQDLSQQIIEAMQREFAATLRE